MSDIAIRVENLSKQYPSTKLRAGRIGGPSTELRTKLRTGIGRNQAGRLQSPIE